MADPSAWADRTGALQFYGVLALMLVVLAIHLVGSACSDWLDEHWGRGSIRDDWLLEGDDKQPSA